MKRFPHIERHHLASEMLKGNPMGNDSDRVLPIYLPPDYDEDDPKGYPVLLFLAGWSGRGERYLNDEGSFLLSMPEIFDQLILDGEAPAFVAAFPDGSTRLGASQYVNSASNGPFMDHLCDEIVPFVDRNYNTRASNDFRGVLGHSSGGFGALVLGLLRPDCFRYICSSAGDSFYDFLYVQCIPKVIRAAEKYGNLEKFVEKFLSRENPLGYSSRDEGEAFMTLSICTAFLPNPKVPGFMGDLFFDLKTGKLIPEKWEAFCRWDPIQMIENHSEFFDELKFVLLESGKDDEYGLHLGHRQLEEKFLAKDIKVELKEYSGKHGGHHHRFGRRAQRLLKEMPLV